MTNLKQHIWQNMMHFIHVSPKQMVLWRRRNIEALALCCSQISSVYTEETQRHNFMCWSLCVFVRSSGTATEEDLRDSLQTQLGTLNAQLVCIAGIFMMAFLWLFLLIRGDVWTLAHIQLNTSEVSHVSTLLLLAYFILRLIFILQTTCKKSFQLFYREIIYLFLKVLYCLTKIKLKTHNAPQISFKRKHANYSRKMIPGRFCFMTIILCNCLFL